MDYLQQLRAKMGHKKVLMIYTCACVRNAQGQVLWQKRGDFGYWGLPGGILELEEDLPTCVIREVYEETHLRITPTRLIGIYSTPDLDVTYPNLDETQQVTFFYDCQVNSGDLVSDSGETLDLKWLPAGEIPPTALWYQLMAADAFANDPQLSFRRGSPGKPILPEGYIHFMETHMHPHPFHALAVRVVVTNLRGEILLKKQQSAEIWQLPGTWMELGERIDQAAVRAVQTAAGCTLVPAQVSTVISDPRLPSGLPSSAPHRLVQVVFTAHWEDQPCDIPTGNICQFFSPDALPKISSHTHTLLTAQKY